MLLLIDNYDSFTYNLVQIFSALGSDVVVKRNDAINIAQIAKLQPSHIVISPGPGTPDSAGISLDLIKHFSGVIPILGVCLGHQAIAQAFGGKVEHANTIMHGKKSMVIHDGKNLFTGLDNPLQVARYHSLVASYNEFPECLQINAYVRDDNIANGVDNDIFCSLDNDNSGKVIMGIEHKEHKTYGVQFHPESIATKTGEMMLHNFLKL